MSSIVTVAGSSYSVPSEGDSGWATDITNLLVQLATSTKVLQVTSSSFPLTQDLSFGSNFGLKAQYIKSQATNPASAGIVRLGNNESLKWRNAANSADLDLTLNASDALQFNGSSILAAGLGSIVNADVNASAAIAYSKLNLSSSIVNTDISDSAAIAYSKLNLATSIVNADISNSAAIAYSKLNLATSIVNADISASAAIAYSKLNLSTSILNADIAADAEIARSKLATLTASRAMVTDGSGNDSASAVTATELGYVNGVTSSIQTQINTNASTASSALTTHAGVSSSVHGVSGSIVGTSDAQVITNKDIDGGTASNTSRITIPKNTKTNLDGLTRKEGSLVFDTVGKALYFDNGTILKQLLENNETPVVSRAIDSSGQSISTGTVTIVNFNSVTYDTPSAITTGASWKYTHTGATAYFDVSSNLNLVSASGGGSLIIYLYKNGSLYSTNYTLASATAPYAVNLTDSVQLANTDYIDIRVLHNAGANRSLSANNSFITIKKIK